MSLLTQLKLCIQCLPVFSSESPPSSPRPSSAGALANSEKDAQLHGSSMTPPGKDGAPVAEGEPPSFSDASLIHDDNEQKDLPISQQAKVELVSAGLQPTSSAPEATYSPKGEEGNASKQETPHASTTSGLILLPSPISPASPADKSEDDSTIAGSSTALTTWHSEPAEAMGITGGRVRRRDHLKHHLKGLHDQLKQGGQHLKEEGSKHLQNMISNMNKHAGDMEESGSFLSVPRWSVS